MRQPLGYGARQQQFDPLRMMQMYESIKALRQEQGIREEQRKREAQGDVTLAAKNLRESQERIGKEAQTEVFGGTEPSYAPYVEPTMRAFREGKPVPRPLVRGPYAAENLKESTLNVIDMPMGRQDVVEGIKKDRARYDVDVGKARPTYETERPVEETPFAEGGVGYTEPSRQVAERAKIFPIAPEKIGPAIEEQTKLSREQLALKGTRETYPLAMREAKAKTEGVEAFTRSQKAEAEIRETQAKDLPLDRSIKATDLAIKATELNIRGQQAHYTGPEAEAKIAREKDQGNYYRYQLKELQATKARHDAFSKAQSEAVKSNDPQKMLDAYAILGAEGAPALLQNYMARGNLVERYHGEISKTLERVTKNLVNVERDKQPDIHNAVAESDVQQYNQMEDSLSKLLMKNKVRVGSLYTAIRGETPRFGSMEVPREFKERMDHNQLDFTNPKDLATYIAARASGVIYDASQFTRAIELIGREVGAPPETIALVKQDYLAKKTKATGRVGAGTPGIHLGLEKSVLAQPVTGPPVVPKEPSVPPQRPLYGGPPF